MDGELKPTLWRTCRTLANHERLALMQSLFELDELSVSRASELTGHPMDVTSMMLRQLQARGLLRARRQGRWVYYRPAADPLVAHARDVLSALRTSVVTPSSRKRAFRDLTAFTHPRRIALVQAMASGVETVDALRRTCGISAPAFYRQIKKLKERGLVREDDGVYRLIRPHRVLARTLMRYAISCT